MKIGVVGLGLIGGSIFKRLRLEGFEVVGISKSQDGENIYKNFEYLKDCGIVFVCSAMNKTMAILDELENFLKPETVVTDVCSLKTFVCKKKRPYRFIPSHPMAGTEHQGFEYSFPELFEGAKWAITPSDKMDGVTDLIQVIQKMGASVVLTTAEKHDEAVALISHMPMVVAQALFITASENPLALDLAASGFRDMTRLALSNTEMANDMVSMNSENIQNAILKLYKSLGELTSEGYSQKIEQIKEQRAKMFLVK
ncbi:prephenate dehydrogenase/arogenate dehydrogenase family protein [bacterium]|nr:prephenate dehydrogenase/arogenate dehydrogenase family protein [bacterium]